MNTVLPWLGALGGLVVFIGAVWGVIRGISRQVSATEDNTAAINDLSNVVERLTNTVATQGERIARLEGRGQHTRVRQ